MKTKLSTKKMPSFLILLPFLFPAGAGAVPREVTIFPNSARVTEVTRISPQATGQGSFKAVVNLPAQALPDSLTTRLDPNSPLKIEDQSWRQINRQNEGRIGDLRKKLQQTKTERIGVLSAIQSLDAQLQFWQAQAKVKARTAEETVGLAAQIGKSVKKDMQEKLALEPELERLDQKIRELQEEMNRIAGQEGIFSFGIDPSPWRPPGRWIWISAGVAEQPMIRAAQYCLSRSENGQNSGHSDYRRNDSDGGSS
jgi:hypothetical protein